MESSEKMVSNRSIYDRTLSLIDDKTEANNTLIEKLSLEKDKSEDIRNNNFIRKKAISP